jgi:DegV family protein with EDD domain
MARVAIVTDSSADLPRDLAEGAGIVVVPVTADPERDVMRDTEPATGQTENQAAQPEMVGAFERAFFEAARTHDGVVAVLLSSRLGSVVDGAREAQARLADVPVEIEIVDSRSASLGLGFQVLRAAELAREGMRAGAIAAELRTAVDRYHVVFFVESLEHLRQSGRIGRSAAMIASALQLKPLLLIDEGQIVPYERARTRVRAMGELAEFVRELPAVERCAVLYATHEDDAARLADAIVEGTGLSPAVIGLFQIGETVAAHVGPDALGIAVVVADSR